MTENIGFVGLGIMGRGMSLNLLKAGFPLTVWNRTASKMEPVVSEGAQAGDSPADVASKSDIVVVCVGGTADVESVIFGENGIVHGAKPGTLIVDCSTISPIATQDMAKRLAEQDLPMLDAPISGGSEGAANGTLAIMVGGAEDDFNRALPVFEAMGKTITLVGDNGAGQMVKMVNQILVVGNCLAMCEALMFAQAGGVDLKKALSAVENGAAASWMLSKRGPQIIDRDWRPGFTIDFQMKDIRLVREAADVLGTPVLAIDTAFQLYRTLETRGLGSEGNHGLIKALEYLAGFEVGQKPD